MSRAERKKTFEAKILPLMAKVENALGNPSNDLAMMVLALKLGECIAETDEDAEERRACFEVMMTIVMAGFDEEF